MNVSRANHSGLQITVRYQSGVNPEVNPEVRSVVRSGFSSAHWHRLHNKH